MRKKDKKESLKDRLEHDENAWVKLLGSMGDFAKYWRQLEAQEKKDRQRIKDLESRVAELEKAVDKLSQR